VATAIARGIQVELSQPEASELARSRTVIPEAYEAYLKGRYESAKRTPEGLRAALSFFQTAAAKDPTFAAAYAGLAVTYMNLSNYQMSPAANVMPQALQAAEKSLALDDRLAEAHAALAAIRFYGLERTGIESEFLKAIALNPGYAQGLHWYALFLAAEGRKEESITEIKLAREIDPRSLIINANVGWCYYLAGNYDKAVEAEKETLRQDPSFGVAYGYLSQAYLEKGLFNEAIDAARNFVSLAPGDVSRRAELAAAYGRAGRKKEAQEILSAFSKMNDGQYISAYDWAMAYSGLGDKEETMDWLQKAYQERNGRLVNLGPHPQFAFLRKESAFQELVSRWQVANSEGGN
jgi:tetratricopeptide (TPR) repeat protein